MSTKASKEGKFMRCIKAPVRFLTRARNFYIKSMYDCASNVGTYGSISAMGCPAPQISSSVPKSFSVRSSASRNDDHDLNELMRAAVSTRTIGMIDLELVMQQHSRKQSSARVAGVKAVPRSRTIAIGRIDEDEACEFGGDIKLMTDVFPRSISHAVTNRRFFQKQSTNSPAALADLE